MYLFHDRYDIPAKAKDKERLGESEQMFEYLICVISPVTGDYEPGEPECGFLFPAFFDGGAALNCVDVFQADSEHPHQELLQNVIFRKILKNGSFFSTIKRKGKRIERFERRKDESENSTCCISGI